MHIVVFLLLWLHVQFCGGDIFVIQMMLSIDMLNIKVVDNLLIFLVLKFHDFRPTGLGVIDFISLLSAFSYALFRSERLCCLTQLSFESPLDDNKEVVVILLRFPKYQITPFLVVQNSSYSCSKWNCIFLSKSGQICLLDIV